MFDFVLDWGPELRVFEPNEEKYFTDNRSNTVLLSSEPIQIYHISKNSYTKIIFLTYKSYRLFSSCHHISNTFTPIIF